MTIEEKKLRMEQLHGQLVQCTKKISHAQSILDSLNHRHWKLKMEFQALDRELSITDGRHRVVSIRKAEKKEAAAKFTREQVEAIAAQLGIDIKFQ